MARERLFIALPLPETVRELLTTLVEPLPGVVWSRPDQLHVTLRFLGDISIEQNEAVIDRLATVRVESFLLPLEGIGAFPPKGPPRVLWVGLGTGHPRLYQLRQRLDDALLAAGLNLDVRTFQPHITLARCGEGSAGAIAQWLRKHREFVGPLFQVENFDLCASELLPGGALHRLKRRFDLRG